MDSYDNFDLIGDDNLMQDAFKFGDLEPDSGCCYSNREGDWDPFSASDNGSHISTAKDASIWSEELLNSIVSAEMVMGDNAIGQLDGKETQVGPTEGCSGNFKSVMVIDGYRNTILGEGESQVDPTLCDPENFGVEMVIGGEINGQMHEIEGGVCPIEYNYENLESQVVTKEESVIEASDVEADSGCTLHDPGPLGDYSPEIELVIDKLVASDLMEKRNKTEETESTLEENLTECSSENTGGEMVGGSRSTLDQSKCHVGPTESDSVILGPEMVVGRRNKQPSEGECYVGPTGQNAEGKIVNEGGSILDDREYHVGPIGSDAVILGAEMVVGGRESSEEECQVGLTGKNPEGKTITEGERNGQSNEGESHAGFKVDDSENLADEMSVERDIHDQAMVRDRQLTPASPSCENLIEGDAEMMTTGNINSQSDERGFQIGPMKLVCRSENKSDAFQECIGTSKSTPPIRENIGQVHEVPQEEKEAADLKCSLIMGGEGNTQEEIVTAVSHSEMHVEQVGSTDLHESADEKDGAGSQLELSSMETGGEGEQLKSELRERELSIPPAFSLCEASVVKVDSGRLLLDLGPLSNSAPETHLTIDKPVPQIPPGPPIISSHSLDNKSAVPRSVETAPFSDSSSTEANIGGHHQKEINTKKKEVKERTTKEYGTADCRSHTPVGVTAVKAGSAEKHDKNEEALNENVLIRSDDEIENNAPYKNLESSFGQNIQEAGTSRFLATNLTCQNPTVVEALPESPAGMGNTEELHDPSDDMTTAGEFQAVQPIQINQFKSDSIEKSVEEIPVTYENSTSVRELLSSMTEIVCKSDLLSEVIKDTTEAVETVPHTELHYPMDGIGEHMYISPAPQSIDVKAAEPLDRKIGEETEVDSIPENSIINDVTMEDTGLEPSPVEMLSEPHRDASSVEGTQEMDNDRMSVDCCVQKKGDEATNGKNTSGKAGIINDPTVEDTGPTLFPVNISSECHVDAGFIDFTPVQFDALEQDQEDVALSVKPVMEINEEHNANYAPLELDVSAATDDVIPRFSPAKISSEFNMRTSSIDGMPVQPEDKMKDCKFSGDPLSEKSTEENYENTPTKEDGELSISRVKLTPTTDMDVGVIDRIQPEDDFKNVKISEKCGDKYMKYIEECEITIDEAPKEDVGQQLCSPKDSSGAHTNMASVDSTPMPSETEINDAPEYKNENLHVHDGTSKSVTETPPMVNLCSTHFEVSTVDCVTIQPQYETVCGEDLRESIQRSETMVCSVIEELEPQVESPSKKPQSGSLVGVTPVNFVRIQSDLVMDDGTRSGNVGVVQSNGLEGEHLGGVNRRCEANIGSLVEEMKLECQSTPAKKQGRAHIEVNSTDCSPIQSYIAASLSNAEGEDFGDASQSDTMVTSLEEEIGTQSKRSHQKLVVPIEAETVRGGVTGTSSENANASSADKLSPNYEIGDAIIPQLENVPQCILTESNDPKPKFPELGSGKKSCSEPACRLSEENTTGVSRVDKSSPNVAGAVKQRQVKLIVPEHETREDKNSFKSPSAHASVTVVDDKTQDLKKRNGVSGSKVHYPSTSEAVMSGEAFSSGTLVGKNVKLPDLNIPHPATATSHDSLTEARQMQLRAQIFVYGSLREGSLPLEAYMAKSFGESERCVWEPIWHAYAETLKNRSPLGSCETPTLSESRARNEPSQLIRVRFESEKPRRRKRSFADEARSPGQNYVCRTANIAAATDKAASDSIAQLGHLLVSPIMTYARHSKKEKTGLEQAGPSCVGDPIVKLRPTSQVLTNNVVPGGDLGKGPDIKPIFSLDRGRSVLLHAALPIYQPQSPSRYCQITPSAPSQVLVDHSSRQAEESSLGASEVLKQSPHLWESVALKCSSTDPQDEVATAAAAATAESVAKAAAAARLASEAARLASEAALQAKLLADEAMGLMGPNPGPEPNKFQTGMELEMVTPAKVLKAKNKVHESHPIVSAMREASRRRVKLATAASKRAENVNTILGAAELAAEAVSQAGQALLMGDPLPFSIADTVEAIGGVHLRAVQSGEADVAKRGEVVDMGLATLEGAEATQVGHVSTRDTVPLSLGESELTGIGEDVPVGNSIKKGSYVEVRGEKDGLNRVWFGAVILDFKNGMAHVRYTDLPSCKEEWVPLERGTDGEPMLRLAHPVTTLKSDRNRKRRREYVSSYSWSVGDHVDAWMRDGWWECIIAQKHGDEAKFTVRFPARGDSLVVGEWDLRPSLVWKDGSCVEWVRVKESSQFNKGDSPLEKRQRVGPTPQDREIVMPKPNLSRSTEIPRPLKQYARGSTSLRIGANGKRDENTSDPKRTGPRVCFGVPRPNKKTKCLEVAEVSRHRLGKDPTPVPNSSGQAKQQRPLTKIPEPSKAPLSSSELKGLEVNLTKVRGKKPVTEPVSNKRVFSSTIRRGQDGTSDRKGAIRVGSGTSKRAGKAEVVDMGPNEPRRSTRKVKPTPRLLEGLETNGLISKIPGTGSAKGLASSRGPTRQ